MKEGKKIMYKNWCNWESSKISMLQLVSLIKHLTLPLYNFVELCLYKKAALEPYICMYLLVHTDTSLCIWADWFKPRQVEICLEYSDTRMQNLNRNKNYKTTQYAGNLFTFFTLKRSFNIVISNSSFKNVMWLLHPAAPATCPGHFLHMVKLCWSPWTLLHQFVSLISIS